MVSKLCAVHGDILPKKESTGKQEDEQIICSLGYTQMNPHKCIYLFLSTYDKEKKSVLLCMYTFVSQSDVQSKAQKCSG